MRLIRVISFIVTLLILSAGCNDDVFIERLEASQTEFKVPSLGGKFEIMFSHGDWNVERIAVNRVDVDGAIHEENGEEVYGPLRLNGYGYADFNGSFTSFSISRTKDDAVVMTFGPSLTPTEVMIDLHISNGFENVVISFVQEPCSGYRFDRIEYGRVTEAFYDLYDGGWEEEFYNETPAVETKEIKIFNENSVRTISFVAGPIKSDDVPTALWFDFLDQYVVEQFEVPVPDPYLDVYDSKITFGGESAIYGKDDVYLPLDYSGKSFSYTFGPWEKVKIKVQWGYWIYYVDYTIWLAHDAGGRPISLRGTMSSKTYNGTWVKSVVRYK